jgi:hypothetical protein
VVSVLMNRSKKKSIAKRACSCRKGDMRCCCGKLLAKKTGAEVIIRCTRCKREMVIDLADLLINLDTGWSEVTFKEKIA